MSHRYTYVTTLSWGGDEPTAELEVECSYEVAWGTPETGRGYLADPYKYDPGSASAVEAIKIISVDGKPWPVDLSYGYQTEAQDHDMLVEKLADEEDAMIARASEEENRSRPGSWSDWR